LCKTSVDNSPERNKNKVKSSIDALNELTSRFNDDWKQILDNYLKDEEEVPEEAGEYIENFLAACKEDTISDKQENWNKLESRINNDLLYDNLRDYIKKSLRTYYIAAPVRALDALDAEKASTVMKEMFDSAILRFDIDIIDKYEDYGFSSQEALTDFLNMLDSFCSYMVERNFCRSSIEKYAKYNMRFSSKLCKQIASIIDRNFQQLKINYIIDHLKAIKENMK